MLTHVSEQLPTAVYDAAQVAAFDQRLIQTFGVPGFTLMQRAAQAAYGALQQRWPQARCVCIVCGPGNNGGDGYLLGQLALQAGCRVHLISLVAPQSLHGDAAAAYAAFVAAGGEVTRFADADRQLYMCADVVVDSLLGTGLSRDVEGRFAAAIACINAARDGGAGVLAVDIASGIDAGTGRRWGTAVRAHVTVTFIGLKLGLFTGAGAGHCGTVVFADLGAPAALYADTQPLAQRMDDTLRRHVLTPRAANAHKGDHGHVLCLGGNRAMGGAVRMSAEAALRSGAGLVSVACHSDHAAAMTQARPELMCMGLADGAGVPMTLARASVLAVGPGLGVDGWARDLCQQALAAQQPLVVDADALNLLAEQPQARGNWILTPHPGEAARLLGVTTSVIKNDRPGCARALAQQFDAVVVLKGAGSLVATPDQLWLCTAGNPGMAGGGMGDLLTGIIAGLAAQGLTLAAAARLGVWLHARAADVEASAHGERGLLATDLLPALWQQVNP